MPPNFAVEIKIDGAAQAAAAAKRVTDELERTERASRKAGEEVARMLANGSIKADQAAAATKGLTRELLRVEQAAESAKSKSSGLHSELARLQNLSFGNFAQGSNSITAMIGNLGLAGNAVSGFASAFGNAAKGAVDFHIGLLAANDGLIETRNKLRNVTTGQEQLAKAMTDTRRIADATRTDWMSTADVYSRVAGVTKQMGFDMNRTARFTETLSKVMGSSGRSTGETSAAMMQLSQALGSGRLNGDEFNSISENASHLLDIFAEKLGVSRGALRDMAAEGKITSKVIVDSIESIAPKTDIAFAQMETTFKQRMQSLVSDFQQDPTKDMRMAAQAGSIGGSFDAIGMLGARAPELMPDRLRSAFEGLLAMSPALADLDLPQRAGEVSALGKSIGAMSFALIDLNKQLGGQTVPAVKSWEEQVDAITKAHKAAHPEVWALWENLEKMTKAAKDAAAPDSLDAVTDKINGLRQSAIEAKVDLQGMWSAFKKAAIAQHTGITPLDDWQDANKKSSGGLLHEGREPGKDLATPWKNASNAISDYQKLLNSIQDPLKNFNRDQGFLNTMLATGKIDVEQYTDAIRKMIAALSDADKARNPTSATHSVFGTPTETGPQTALADDLAKKARELHDQLGGRGAGANMPRGRGVGLGAPNMGGAPSLFGSGATPDGRDDVPGGIDWDAIAQNQQRALEQMELSWGSYEGKIMSATKALEEQRKTTETLRDFATTAMGSVGDSIVSFTKTGEFSFEKMINSMMEDLTRLIIKQLIAAAISAAIGGPGGGAAANAGMNFLMNSNNTMSPGSAAGASNAPRNATGASYMIRGEGGIDSVPFPLAMVSPGEQVDVIPRARAGRGGGGESAPKQIKIYFDGSLIASALDTHEGEEMVMKIVHRNPAAIRGAITGR